MAHSAEGSFGIGSGVYCFKAAIIGSSSPTSLLMMNSDYIGFDAMAALHCFLCPNFQCFD